MNQVTWYTVDEATVGQRIDNFLLTHLKGVPRPHVYRLIRKGEVRVNKKRIEQTYRLQLEDLVRIPPVVRDVSEVPVKLSTGLTERLQAAVLYEDAQLLIINKPAGMAVHGGSGVTTGVIEYLRVAHPEYKFLELVHRLDRDTSGCLMIAKSRAMLTELHALLRERKVKKIYQLLAVGTWPKNLHKVDAPLEKNQRRSGERVVRVTDEGQASVTTFNIVETLPGLTVVEAFPHTGRTHQIRVHAMVSGHPIIGDEKYGDRATNQTLARRLGSKRLFLHALALKLTIPSSGQKIDVRAELDDAWRSSVELARAGV